MTDLASRIDNRIQLTSDGLRAYIEAVDAAFAGRIDYAQLVKIYGDVPESAKGRYSPAECTGAIKTPIIGLPDPDHISTSFVERTDDADAYASVHSPDERVQQEIRSARERGGSTLRLL